MHSIIDALESGPLLAGLDKPQISIRTIKGLIREALAELAEPPLDGEDGRSSAQQQKLCHFTSDTATVHAQWVAVRPYSYVPPRTPEPMNRRRLLRHNAIEVWETMRKTGWRPCPPPVRWRSIVFR